MHTGKDLNKQTFIGTYVRQDFKKTYLTFDQDSFAFVEDYNSGHLSLYYCCDTVSYGKWDLDKNGFIVLSSPEKYNTTGLRMNITEEQVDSDSIYFIIDNPIESHFKKYKGKSELSYQILVYWEDHMDYEEVNSTPSHPNFIAIPKPKEPRLKKFWLTVVVNCNIALNHLERRHITGIPVEHNEKDLFFYHVKNPDANLFRIDIPGLDFQFIALRRLNQDYIKIINRNKLLWDGKVYIKQ